MDPTQLPPSLQTHRFLGLTLMEWVMALHMLGQFLGRALTALRGQGGLRGVFFSVYGGSATATGDQPKNVPITKSPGPGGMAAAALLFILCLFTIWMATGCGGPARLEPGGAYAPVGTNGVVTAQVDYAFFVADAAYDTAYATVDAAFTFERQNRALLWKLSPEIKHGLDKLRPEAWGVVVKYAKARAAYLDNPVPDNLTALQQVLAEAQRLATTVQAILPQGTQAKPAAAAPAASPFAHIAGVPGS